MFDKMRNIVFAVIQKPADKKFKCVVKRAVARDAFLAHC